MENFEKYKQWKANVEFEEEAQIRELATDLRDLICKHVKAGLDEALAAGSVLEFAAVSLFLMTDPGEDVEKILVGAIKKIAQLDVIINHRKKINTEDVKMENNNERHFCNIYEIE